MRSRSAYLIVLAFLFSHEVDAAFRHEWRVLPLTSFMPEDAGRETFIWAHVPLFAGLLRKDDDGYVLVTPVEKLSIAVEDVPFRAVTVDAVGNGEGQSLTFTTNVGDQLVLSAQHALRVTDGVPYLHVRRGLEAKVARNVWYQLADIAVVRGGEMGVWSGGQFFALGPA